MSEIIGSVQKVSDVIGAISTASTEQSSSIGQVTQAVVDLDRVTLQNAALVEQSAAAAAAASLKDQAQRMTQSVEVFKI